MEYTNLSGKSGSVQQFLNSIHNEIYREFPDISRIAAVTYDRETDELKTFVQSNSGEVPLSHYSARLKNVPSLASIAMNRKTRVIDRLQESDGAASYHSRVMSRAGFKSSYTVPFYDDDGLCGFLFVNATEPEYFSTSINQKLKVYIELIISNILNALTHIRFLKSHIKVLCNMSCCRDVETGDHLQRMSHYARVIAKEIAPKKNMDDEFVEYVFLFAPLHDIGKIAVPDSILLKQSKLTNSEFVIMQQHIKTGEEIIDDMMQTLKLHKIKHISLLKNIVIYHHELYDGSGYMKGLKGEEIPLEARIISIADVFDALTSKRPYKEPWSNERAFEYIRKHSGKKFDPECVDALFKQQEKILEIQKLFSQVEPKEKAQSALPKLQLQFAST